jgi:phosphohistidine phosphatase
MHKAPGGPAWKRLAVVDPSHAQLATHADQRVAQALRVAATIGRMIWLLRHGDAEDQGPDDDARRLTPRGEQEARAAAGALVALEVQVDACLSSPKVRAFDTARAVCTELGVAVEEIEALRGGDFDPEELAAGHGDVLLVGHEPDLSRAIQAATGARVELKKGGLAAIEDGSLITLLRPAQLRAIASGR